MFGNVTNEVGMNDLVNGLKHTQDDHECCRGTIQMAIDRIAVLERELAEAQRQSQEMETKLHNECQAHERTKSQIAANASMRRDSAAPERKP